MSTTSTATNIICPDWCRHEEVGHDPYLRGEVLLCHHIGPEFGRHIAVEAEQVGESSTVRALVTIGEDPISPAEMLQLARDVLAAAEWMEAHS